jgi:two-component system response regulator VicR
MSASILIVDDSKLVTDIVKMRLEMHGYEVEVAHNGEEGLRRVRDSLPDLVVLDVQMPATGPRRSADYHADVNG